jgi:hypothetical protein
LIHLISLGTSLCLALRALLCNVQFGSPAKLSSQARYFGHPCPSPFGPTFGRSKLFQTIWSASSGTSPGFQILIDPPDLEYNGINTISRKPHIPLIIN